MSILQFRLIKVVSELKEILENNYKSIITIDFKEKESNFNFWFISKNKEEPRVASRYEENGSELEQPLAIARDIKKLYEKIHKRKIKQIHNCRFSY